MGHNLCETNVYVSYKGSQVQSVHIWVHVRIWGLIPWNIWDAYMIWTFGIPIKYSSGIVKCQLTINMSLSHAFWKYDKACQNVYIKLIFNVNISAFYNDTVSCILSAR